jgi:nitrogen fixation protein NifU and related proteins
MSDIKELYQEIILDHNKSPRNFRRMDNADRVADGHNPLCGDRYTIYIKLADGKIFDVSFEGSGCAISKASASVMTATLKGKAIDETKELFEKFHRMVKGELASESDREELGKLLAFEGVSEFPVRVKCASLAWHTVVAALENSQEHVTTE